MVSDMSVKTRLLDEEMEANIKTEAAQEGAEAAAASLDISDCPYARDTLEWEAWRLAWAEANKFWHGVLMDKRKASTE